MAKAARIAVVGSANTDLTTFTDVFPRPGETLFGKSFDLGFGGKGAPRGKGHGDEGGKRERLQHDISSADVGLQEGDDGGGDLFHGAQIFFSTPLRPPSPPEAWH